MASERIICTVSSVDYLSIRMAMCQDARTVEEVKAITGLCGECEGCKTELPGILSSVCGCENVSLKAVVDAVLAGADTVEKVEKITRAGSDCGRCKKLVENIIKLKR